MSISNFQRPLPKTTKNKTFQEYPFQILDRPNYQDIPQFYLALFEFRITVTEALFFFGLAVNVQGDIYFKSQLSKKVDLHFMSLQFLHEPQSPKVYYGWN